jgi:hypothetical protein
MALQNAYTPVMIACFPYLANVQQQSQQPSDFPMVPTKDAPAYAGGTEFTGVGIAPVGSDNAGKGVQPNSVVVTPAVNETNITTAWANGQNLFPIRGTSTAVV